MALTTPELAVLLAYTKIVLAQELLESDLPDDSFLRGELFGYFPTQLRQDFREAMAAHPLRREIIVTQVVNNLVNFAGITFYHRLSQETVGQCRGDRSGALRLPRGLRRRTS